MKRKSTASHGRVARRRGPKYKVMDRTRGISSLKIKNAKAVKTKVMPKVKVSAGLRAKIKKVILDKQFASGSLTDHYIGGGFQMLSRRQFVGAVGGPSSWLFTIPAFVDVASQLFNGKGPSSTPITKYNLGVADNLNGKNITFDVKNSYTTYTIKNGSQHAAHIIMAVCVPKRKGCCIEWDPDVLGQQSNGVTIATADAITAADSQWSRGLTQDYNDGIILNSWQPPLPANLNGAGSLQGPSTSDLFRMPSSCRTFNNAFKVEYIKFFLQPGQVVEHRIQGPKMLEIDLSKSYTNSVLNNVQKYSRSVFFMGYNSPNSLAVYETTPQDLKSAAAGRWADQIDNKDSGFPIYVERADHFSISIPDQIGFTMPTPVVQGARTNLDRRISREINNVWDVPATLATGTNVNTVVDLSVMNPQIPVNDGRGPAA